MKNEKSKKTAISSYIELNELSKVSQIKGLGRKAETKVIYVNIEEIIDKITGESFRLDIEVKIKGYSYNFSKIYKLSEIGEEKNLTVGNISLVEDIEDSDIEVISSIINIIKE